MIKVGDEAPDFELPLHTGGAFRLSNQRGKNTVVLYFYPKDFTMNCTKEACTFRDYNKEVETFGGMIVGISGDDIETHKKFTEAYRLSFSLASDNSLEVCKCYGAVWFGGLKIKRVTFVIDKQGIVYGKFHHEWSVESHWSNVLKALHSLQDEDRSLEERMKS